MTYEHYTVAVAYEEHKCKNAALYNRLNFVLYGVISFGRFAPLLIGCNLSYIGQFCGFGTSIEVCVCVVFVYNIYLSIKIHKAETKLLLWFINFLDPGM